MREFENDPMMRRLHKFREEEHKATRNLSFKEEQKRNREKIEQFLNRFGYKLVSTGRGTSKMVKIK